MDAQNTKTKIPKLASVVEGEAEAEIVAVESVLGARVGGYVE